MKGKKGCKQTKAERLESIRTLVPGSAQTHGAYALKALDQTAWPLHIKRLYVERVQELSAMHHIVPIRDRGIVHQTAYLELLCGIIRQWTLEHGVIRSKGKSKDMLQPCLNAARAWEKLLQDAYRQMGLSPAAQRNVMQPTEKTFTELLEEAADAGVDNTDTNTGGGDTDE